VSHGQTHKQNLNTQSNMPSRQAHNPAMVADVPVMTNTATRAATNQREVMSSACHSSGLSRGIAHSALPYIAKYVRYL
jgi:hypothetical protein